MKKIFFSSLTLFISVLFIAVHTVSAQGPTRTPTPGGGTFTLTVQAVIPNSTGGTVPAVKGKTILVRTTFNAQRQWPAISNPMQMQISLKNSSNAVVSTITSNNLFQGGNDTQFTIPATTPSGTGYYIEVRGLQTVENGPTRVNPTAKSAPFSVVDPSLTPSPSRSPTPSRTPTPTTRVSVFPSSTPATTSCIAVCSLKAWGDANCNDVIDAVDENIWRSKFLNPQSQDFAQYDTDFNKDGKTSLIDKQVWVQGWFVQPAPSRISCPVTSVTSAQPTATRAPSPTRTPTTTATRTPTPTRTLTPTRTPTPTPTKGPVYSTSFNTTGSGIGIDMDTSGNIYITDETNGVVRKFSQTGQLLLTIGSKGNGNGQFQYPYDVAVNPQTGAIVVTDMSAPNKVQVFNPNGTFNKVLTSPNGISGPRGIDYDRVNSDLYIADVTRAVVHRMTMAGAWSMIGANAGVEQKLISPTAVAASLDKVYVMEDDGIGPRIKIYNSNGTYVKMFNNGQFQRNSYIDVDSSGYIYVSDYVGRKILKFQFDGVLTWSFPIPTSGNGSIGTPVDIVVDGKSLTPNGFKNIHVVDNTNRKVVIFNQP